MKALVYRLALFDGNSRKNESFVSDDPISELNRIFRNPVWYNCIQLYTGIQLLEGFPSILSSKRFSGYSENSLLTSYNYKYL